MKIRNKLFLITGVVFLCVVLISSLSVWTTSQIASYQRTLNDGVQLIADMRNIYSQTKDLLFGIFTPQMYSLLKDLIYTPRLDTSRKLWWNSITIFKKNLEAFMASDSLQNLLRDEELKKKYDLALQMSRTAFEKLEAIKKHIDRLDEVGVLFTTDLYIEIQKQEDETLIEFFNEVRETNYYFTNNFESFLNSFIDSLRRESLSIQQQILYIFWILTSLIGVFTLIFSLIFSNRISQRVSLVEGAIKNVSQGDFSAKLKIKTNDEFGLLSDNFNVFIKDLKQNVNAVLDFMKEVGSSISEHFDLPKIYDLIVRAVVKDTGADVAALFMLDNERTKLEVKANSGMFPPPFPLPEKVKEKHTYMISYFKDRPIVVKDTIFEEVLLSGEPLFVKDTQSHKKLSEIVKDSRQFFSSIIIIPLFLYNQIEGFLTVAKTTPGSNLTDLDFTHLISFTDYASLTINNYCSYLELLEKRELERDVNIAAEIQKNLLPKKISRLDNASLFAFSSAAKGVSGDYFDIIRLSKDKVAILICDVAGKGIPASLVMVMIRTIFHLTASPKRDPSTILEWINRGITGYVGLERFATILVFIFDQKKQEITFSNAAHLPLLIFRNTNNDFETLDTEGLPIGIEKESRYIHRVVKLNQGDIVLLYTDGVVEARNPRGEEYSLERLQTILKDSSGDSASAIVNNIKHDVDSFESNAKQHDDRTVVVMKAV